MIVFNRFLAWLKAILRRSSVERDMNDELQFHMEALADDLVRSGLPREEALRRARLEFGGLDRAKEECRDARGTSFLESILQDLRFAFRMLRKSPGFTAAAALTLALAIGANTAIFSLIDSVIISSLPVRNPHQLVQLRATERGSKDDPNFMFTNPIWEAFRNDQNFLAGTFAWSSPQPMDLAQGGAIQPADNTFVSGDFYNVLGIRPALGRLISNSDDQRGCPPVAVLSHNFWQAHYAGAENVLGSSISLNKRKFPIIGVTPDGFNGLDVGRKFDVAVPICAAALFDGAEPRLAHRSWWWLNIMARQKPGTTLAQANARLSVLSSQVFQESVPLKWGKEDQDEFLRNVLSAAPGNAGVSDVRRQYQKPLTILMAVVGLVLLIACANIASLMLARAIARNKELAVRKALGASRFRLIRQLLTECILLAAIGGAFGTLLAHWGNRVLVRFLSTSNDQVYLDFSLNLRVLAFTALSTLFTAILFGLLPAFRSTRISLTAAMKGAQTALGDRHLRVHPGKWIVAVQVALSLVLLITAGLFLRSFVKLAHVDTGFDRNNVAIISADLKTGNVRQENRLEVARQIEDSLRSVPGVVSVGSGRLTPISGGAWDEMVVLPGSKPVRGDDNAVAFINYISPRYLEALRIPLLAGRPFDDHDATGAPNVAIINETMARRFFHDAVPLGKLFRFQDDQEDSQQPPAWIQVVGVMRDSKYLDLEEKTRPQAFMPFSQFPRGDTSNMEFVVRSNLAFSALVPAAVEAVGRVSKSLPLRFNVLSRQLDDNLSRERVLATLSAFFGALALLLAMIGLYGALSYLVTQRQHEFGIRLALGAPPNSIFRLVLMDLFFVLGGGILAGVVISFSAIGFLEKMLFDLAPRDPFTTIFAVVLLSVVALTAAYLPARRAMQTDPLVALRYE